MIKKNKKRVGIIIDTTLQTKQIWDLIKLSKSSKNYEISTILINKDSIENKNLFIKIIDYAKRRGFKKCFSFLVFQFICKIESIVIKKSRRFHDFYNKFELDKLNFHSLILNPIISKSGLIYRYPIKDIENIKKLNLDLLIRAGSGILRGDILNACPNGIISFHHGDNKVNRGGPPGFWEVYERHPRTGFIIQRLTNELDGGDVLFRGFILTSWFYSLNLARLYESSNPFLHTVIEDITSINPKLVVHKKVPYSNRLYTDPSIWQSLNYIKKTISFIVSRLKARLLNIDFRWGVAYQFSKSWNDVALWRSIRYRTQKIDF